MSVWWAWVVGTSSVCLVLATKNMGRTGPIPPSTPVEDPWAALFVGALLWALVSVLVATESANAGDAASCVGLGGVVPVRIAGCGVLLREVRVTTFDGRIFLSGGPGPVGPERSHMYRTSC